MSGIFTTSLMAILQRQNKTSKQTTSGITSHKDTHDCTRAVHKDHTTIHTLKGDSVVVEDLFDEPKFVEPTKEPTPMVVVEPTATTTRATCAMIPFQDKEEEFLDEDQSDCDSEYVDDDENSEGDEGDLFCKAQVGSCLSPELMELARILESNGMNHFQWDWDIIFQEATPNLKSLIDSKRSSLHKNPMQILVGNTATPLFQAYRRQLRQGRDDKDADVGTQSTSDSSGQKLTCDPIASTKAQSEITNVALPNVARHPRRAACSHILDTKTDHILVSDVVSSDKKASQSIVNTSVEKSVGYDANDHNIALVDNVGLPSELLELAHIVALQPSQGRGAKWDWHYILNNASVKLLEFISIKKSKGVISRRSVVGEELLPAFESYHVRLRKKLRCSEIHGFSKDAPVMKKIRHTNTKESVAVGKSQLKEARLVTNGDTVVVSSRAKKQTHFVSNGIPIQNMKARYAQLATTGESVATNFRIMSKQTRVVSNDGTKIPRTDNSRHTGQATKGETVTAPSRMKKKSHLVYNGVIVPTDMEGNVNGLSSELQELAGLLAKAKGSSWAFIETQASPRLKSYICDKARADPSYISTPMVSLVPACSLEVFNELVKRCSIERVERQNDDFSAVSDEIEETHERGNTKHRKLGQTFAMERKRRITAMTANLRAQLVAFEEQEVTLWDSFLQG
jgi:hypothetical protein